MIDRLLALWQYLNDSEWLTKPGDANTPLAPFHSDTNRTIYNSAADSKNRHFEQLNYTYPELVGHPSKEEVLAQIKKLYGAPLERLMLHQDVPGNEGDTSPDFLVNVTYDR